MARRPDIYTTHTHLKRLLAGQATAAYTPVGGEAAKLMRFAPGMGVLNSSADDELQCPVCGAWMPSLTRHLNTEHRGAGGAAAVKRALGFPAKATLIAPGRRKVMPKPKQVDRPSKTPRGKGERSARTASVNWSRRNFADTCSAQIETRIRALARRFGRTPTKDEFEAEYGAKVRGALMLHYGTWNSAVTLCGFEPNARNTRVNPTQTQMQRAVLNAFDAWRSVHGALPELRDVQTPTFAPALPSYRMVLEAFKVSTWQAAIASASAHLQRAR